MAGSDDPASGGVAVDLCDSDTDISSGASVHT